MRRQRPEILSNQSRLVSLKAALKIESGIDEIQYKNTENNFGSSPGGKCSRSIIANACDL
jgi:hypothetical protein